MTTYHYHHGYGHPGYQPETEPTITYTLMDLAESVRTDLGDSLGDLWHEYETYRDAASTAQTDTDVATLRGHAVDAVDMARDIEHIVMMISPSMLTHQGRAGRAQAYVRTVLLETHSQTPVSTRGLQLTIWECSDWRHLLSEHDANYKLPASATSGGVVPCACRDCPGVVYWSATSGRAPYCEACEAGFCEDRDRAECNRDDEGE